MRILGAWYTHNKINPAVLHASLHSLKMAWQTDPKNIEIACAVWEPINGNPHRELIQNQRLSSHFGIALQIGRVLWEYLKEPPDAVCFLEHDVMYPTDYFAKTAACFEANPEAPGVFNHDYIGLNETGWLKTSSRGQPPLHQLSMRWDYAVDWINWRVRECVCNPQQGLEPEDKSAFAIREPGDAPAVHINHGQHFTSHHCCYERQGATHHRYWGNAANYYPQGERDSRE